MNIVEVLDSRLVTLPSGNHSNGLRAVRLHIDAAISHLKRGQGGDSTAFTDAIYRCNQAFEGSVKEAYRVLANKDPNLVTPAKIEDFLSKGSVLRARVLDQFTNYRTKWRNPSTHDYMLDFDENEALLAIVSVTVFAAVLSDQIGTKLAAEAAEKTAPHPSKRIAASASLRDEVGRRVLEFARSFRQDISLSPIDAARQIEGSLAGYLAAQFATTPDVSVDPAYRLAGREADIAVRRGDEMVAIELKLMHRPTASMLFSGIAYLADLIRRGFTDGILFAAVVGEDPFASFDVEMIDGKPLHAVVSQSLASILEQVRFFS